MLPTLWFLNCPYYALLTRFVAGWSTVNLFCNPSKIPRRRAIQNSTPLTFKKFAAQMQ